MRAHVSNFAFNYYQQKQKHNNLNTPITSSNNNMNNTNSTHKNQRPSLQKARNGECGTLASIPEANLHDEFGFEQEDGAGADAGGDLKDQRVGTAHHF
jgi:hypothetical protein